jgi:hypothetical protein
LGDAAVKYDADYLKRKTWETYIAENLERKNVDVHAFNLWKIWGALTETVVPYP